jgi:hypothetical protein
MDFELSPKISYFNHKCSGNFGFYLTEWILQHLYSPSIEEIVVVKIKQNGNCIVEASDGYPGRSKIVLIIKIKTLQSTTTKAFSVL